MSPMILKCQTCIFLENLAFSTGYSYSFAPKISDLQVWELFGALGAPQRDVFGLDCPRHAMGPSDFCGFIGFHKRFAIYLQDKSTKPISWTTALPWVACMYASWVWRCDGQSLAPAEFSSSQVTTPKFEKLSSDNFEFWEALKWQLRILRSS